MEGITNWKILTVKLNLLFLHVQRLKILFKKIIYCFKFRRLEKDRHAVKFSEATYKNKYNS